MRLSLAIGRSPCSTCTSTLVWLSAAVENTSLLRVGIVVLRASKVVMTPPSVSIPRDRGVTSSSKRSLDLAGEDPGLDGRTHRHHLVGVHALVGLAVEEGLDEGLHLGDPGGPSDQNHLVNLRRLQPGVGQGLLDRTDRTLEQVVDQLLELGPGELALEMLGARPGRR